MRLLKVSKLVVPIMLVMILFAFLGWLRGSPPASTSNGLTHLKPEALPSTPDSTARNEPPLVSDSTRTQETGGIVLPDRPSGHFEVVIGARDDNIKAFAIHAYDSVGRHIGFVSSPDLRIQGFLIEEQIPNSSLQLFGDKYYLALDGRDTYRVEIRGNSVGNFFLKVIIGISDDEKVPAFYYPGGPVKPGFRGSITFPRGFKTAPPLIIHSDGDGKPGVSQKARWSL